MKSNLQRNKKRLTMCEKNLWFKEQHKQRRHREVEDVRYRKRLHERLQNATPSNSFDWSKYDEMQSGI